MARRKKLPHSRPALARSAGPVRWWLVLLAASWLAFFGGPLFSPGASIQWDAVDVHYSSQRYFAEEILAGRLPVWTPYIFCGFPFLADPQVGAFYPLNWPFMLAGAGPKSIQAELALHSLLAALGVFLLLRLWFDQVWAAGLGAIAYAFSGFFAGHASHVGMYQAACLWPWLLYCAERALRGHVWRWAGATGAVAGLMFLAGHLQTALYGCAALALYVAVRSAADRSLITKSSVLLVVAVGLAFLTSAAMVLPAAELASQSIRAGQDYSTSQEGTLSLAALVTLAAPDALGARGADYHGPGDRTQYYFYGGLLLLPLAALGLKDIRRALAPLAILLAAVWFMLGPAAGLFRIVALAPWFGKFRAPVHAWFVAALALCWLAALGAATLLRRFPRGWLGPALCAAIAMDLCASNSWANPLTYARESYDVLYAQGVELLRARVAPAVPAGMRFAAPDRLTVFGPMNSPLEVRLETTYGYNPLELATYAQYRRAAAQNARLLDALAAARELDASRGAVIERPTALSKAWFPARVRRVWNSEQSRSALLALNPASEAIVTEEAVAPAKGAVVEGIVTSEREWSLRYKATEGGLLVLSLPYYPGWRAEAGGRACPILRVNHALSGLVVPAGRGEVRLRFHSRRLAIGAWLSLLGWFVVAGLWMFGRRRGPAPGA